MVLLLDKLQLRADLFHLQGLLRCQTLLLLVFNLDAEVLFECTLQFFLEVVLLLDQLLLQGGLQMMDFFALSPLSLRREPCLLGLGLSRLLNQVEVVVQDLLLVAPLDHEVARQPLFVAMRVLGWSVGLGRRLGCHRCRCGSALRCFLRWLRRFFLLLGVGGQLG